MADAATIKADRDARLDELLDIFNEYIDSEIKRTEAQVDLLEAILQGHNTPTAAAQTVLDEISVLAERRLQVFLEG